MSTSIDLYPEVIHTGKYGPDSIGPEVDNVCNEIHAATKGFGTNERRLLKAIGGCNGTMRAMVPGRYFQLYNQSLEKVMKSECGNKPFGAALQYLALDPVHAECEMIEDACRGFGTDETFLLSIICGRSNKEVDILKKRYKQLYNKDLVRRIGIELTGKLDTLSKWALSGDEEEYNPNVHTEAKMEQDAEKLRAMGEGRWGTNENGIFKLICTSPPKYVQGLNTKYEAKYGNDLVKALQREFAGVVEKGIVLILRMKLNPYDAVAHLIDEACRGFGTNELMLTAHIIRYQKIMKQVDTVHQQLYRKSIANRIKFETSGDYEKLLVEVVEAA